MKITRYILIACACLSLLSEKSFADPARATVLIDNETGETWVQFAAHGSWVSTSQPPDQEETGAEHGYIGGGRGQR